MCGPARNRQPECDRPGMSDHDIEVRWLRDDREVACRAGPDRGQGPLPAVLLGWDEGDEELTVQTPQVAHLVKRPDRAEDRGDAALHVTCPAAIHRAVADLAGPRVRGPGRGVAWWHDIEMPGQDHPPSAGAPDSPDDDRQCIPW